MAIGKRRDAGSTTTGGPDVHGAAEVEVEVGSDLGRSRLTSDMESLLKVVDEGLSDATLDELIEASRAAKIFIDAVEVARKKFSEEIMSRMCSEGETEHPTADGQWVCQLLVGRTGAKLSETRLLESGVSADVIADCREDGTSYTYIQIKKAKKES